MRVDISLNIECVWSVCVQESGNDMTGPSLFRKTQTTVPVSLSRSDACWNKGKRMEQILLQIICT